MKPRLLWSDRDLIPPEDGKLAMGQAWDDLDMSVILDAIAGDDSTLRPIVATVLASPLLEADGIRARQAVLVDVAQHRGQAEALRDQAQYAMEARRRSSSGFYGVYPSSILHGSISVLKDLMGSMRKTRELAETWAADATAERVQHWLHELCFALDDMYLDDVDAHLTRLDDREELPVVARLGAMNEGTRLTLAAGIGRPRHWWNRFLGAVPGKHTIRIPERDEGGARALGELRDKGINEVANALAQAVDYLLAFFALMHRELAFYLAVDRWRDLCQTRGLAMCQPTLEGGACGIYVTCLSPLSVALRSTSAVPNDIDTSAAPIAIITGPNQGGKTTFLRALGQGQWLAQVGAPVPASLWQSTVFDGVFSHFKQAEDDTLRHGKFDEELLRWNGLVDALGHRALILSNESFATTDAREATELAATLFDAFANAGHHVVAVTHLTGLADALTASCTQWRVERGDGGERPYRLYPGVAEATSYAQDIFRQVFGSNPALSVKEPTGP